MMPLANERKSSHELILRDFPRDADARHGNEVLQTRKVGVECAFADLPGVVLKKEIFAAEEDCATKHHPLRELLARELRVAGYAFLIHVREVRFGNRQRSLSDSVRAPLLHCSSLNAFGLPQLAR